MTQQPLQFDAPPVANVAEGRRLRDEGMKRAADHADRVSAEWGQRALDFLRGWVVGRTSFTSTDVRIAATAAGVPAPTHERAWGPVFMRASRLGLITPAGYVPHPDPRAHATPARLWSVAPSK